MEQPQAIQPDTEARAAREAYLATVEWSLRQRLAPLELYDTVEEMRCHLNAMADAYRELGLSPREAMLAAIDKFGPAKRIGHAVASAQGSPSRADRMVAGLIAGFVSSWIGACLMFSLDTAWHALGLAANVLPSLDFSVGGGVGFVAALIAMATRLRPVANGLTIMVLSNIMLLPIYQGLVKWGEYFYLVNILAFNVLAFVVGAAAALIYRDLQRRMPSKAAPKAMGKS